ncbi:hypothetical protein C8Q79DRAFT_988709 [Trametes meyenii]|nr:hypothetical protein C8Q79DRAFT_988709 [Trametes meyenii]
MDLGSPSRSCPLTLPCELTIPHFPNYRDGHMDGASSYIAELFNLAALAAGDISSIFGGTLPILNEGEAWPRCASCARPLSPYLQVNASSVHTPEEFRAVLFELEDCPARHKEGSGDLTPLFQVFLCTKGGRDFSCLEQSASGAVSTPAWLIRCAKISTRSATGIPRALASAENTTAWGSIDPDFSLPQRVISSWTAGNPEALAIEALDELDDIGDYDGAFFEAHGPASGLKLLGNAVLGKVNNISGPLNGRCTEGAGDDLDADGGHWDYRCLVQLGTPQLAGDHNFSTTGNIWVYQCKQHPDVFRIGYSYIL